MDPSGNASELVDHFFRNEFGKAVSYLTGKFGTALLGEAEDAVQDALIKAMQTWRFGKVPDNPTGWILKVAQNRLIDQLRRNQKVYYTTTLPDTKTQDMVLPGEFFQDELIKMMFACCNPALSPEYQLILTLKILGGLSIREIASGLMKKEEAVAKAYTRAKRKFQIENLKLEIPSEKEIQQRLQTVLTTIYLLFNEGYKSTAGDHLIRRDICEEAMRLNQLLLERRETNNSRSRALMALMHFQASRFDSRTGTSGEAISLQDQDRTQWDQRHIDLGNQYLNSIPDGLNNDLFVQAAISGLHANARSYDETDWKAILKLYNYLYRLNPNPVIALNRVIPFSKVYGEAMALTELEKLESEKTLLGNYLLPATKAELCVPLGQPERARRELEKAIRLTENLQERAYLKKKMTAI